MKHIQFRNLSQDFLTKFSVSSDIQDLGMALRTICQALLARDGSSTAKENEIDLLYIAVTNRFYQWYKPDYERYFHEIKYYLSNDAGSKPIPVKALAEVEHCKEAVETLITLYDEQDTTVTSLKAKDYANRGESILCIIDDDYPGKFTHSYNNGNFVASQRLGGIKCYILALCAQAGLQAHHMMYNVRVLNIFEEHFKIKAPADVRLGFELTDKKEIEEHADAYVDIGFQDYKGTVDEPELKRFAYELKDLYKKGL